MDLMFRRMMSEFIWCGKDHCGAKSADLFSVLRLKAVSIFPFFAVIFRSMFKHHIFSITIPLRSYRSLILHIFLPNLLLSDQF
jgi:hypothetical protein